MVHSCIFPAKCPAVDKTKEKKKKKFVHLNLVLYITVHHSISLTFQQLNADVHFEDLVYHSTLQYIVLISGKPHTRPHAIELAWRSRVQTFRVSASWNWIAVCTHKIQGILYWHKLLPQHNIIVWEQLLLHNIQLAQESTCLSIQMMRNTRQLSKLSQYHSTSQ